MVPNIVAPKIPKGKKNSPIMKFPDGNKIAGVRTRGVV